MLSKHKPLSKFLSNDSELQLQNIGQSSVGNILHLSGQSLAGICANLGKIVAILQVFWANHAYPNQVGKVCTHPNRFGQIHTCPNLKGNTNFRNQEN